MIENNNNHHHKKIQKFVIATTLVGSLLLSGNLVSASETSVSVANSSSYLDKSAYRDYKEGQYWSEDMLWAIQNDLIKGFQFKENAATVNELKPKAELTEAQLLIVLFRYFSPEELASTTPVIQDFYASTAYQLAEKNHLPTKATLNNLTAANKVTTRGVLAQMLVSLHQNKAVTMQEAVQFMYDTGLSSGLSSSDGTYPQTYASYGINEPLQRAHIVSFMKRYDTFVKTGKVEKPPVVSAPSTGTSMQPIPMGSTKVGNITVGYGKHTYGSNNQAEYDQVMSIVTKAIKDYNEPFGGEDAAIYEDYLNGARGIMDRTIRDPRNSRLVAIDGLLGDFVKAGLSKSTIEKIYKAGSISGNLLSTSTDPLDGTPRSAYDALVRGVTDCDPIAQVASAVYDSMGFNTLILAGDNHAEAFFEVDGHWFMIAGGAEYDLNKIISSTNRVHTQPTDGTIIR